MYAVAPPNRSDPFPGFITGSDELRVYQAWKGSNKFCLGGRFIFGPDVRSLALTVFLIVAPMSLFCVFVARELMLDVANNWGISIMVIAAAFTLFDLVLLLLTSGRDPGIIPRNAYPPEPESCDGNSEGVQTPQTRLPRIKEVEVNGTTVKIKYCDTCMLYRPPRCSHCSICNNCVEKFDHHCPWVGQCIGLRNYRFFFMFVLSTTLLCIYVFGFCWVYIKRIMDSEATSIWKAMIRTPSSIASIVLISYTFIAVWFVGGLTGFHIYLITTNQTTYENFRYRYDQRVNPYNKGVAENFKEIFCGSMPPSRNKFRDKIARETGLPARPVASSAGFVSPNMGNKGVEDIEMGRKAAASWSELEVPLSDRGDALELVENKSNSLAETSPESRTMVDESDRIGIQHLRRASWGRKSGSWEMSPEVVAISSSRMGIGSSTRSTDSSRQNV